MEVDVEASDPHNIALTYLRMEKDVKQLILDTVKEEITREPYGQFAQSIKTLVQFSAKDILRSALPDVRIAIRGESTY